MKYAIGIAVFVGLFVYYANNPLPGTKLDVSGSSLYYTENVEEKDARRLGEMLLTKYKVFDPKQPSSAQIDLKNRRYVLRFIVAVGAENTIKEDHIRDLAQKISQDVFNNALVDVELCDRKYSRPVKRYPFKPFNPKLPVEVTFRKSIGGSGFVAQFLNTSSRILKVQVNLRNFTTFDVKRFSLDLAPNSKIEYGWAEGWNFTSGDIIRLDHFEYESASHKVP